MLNLIIWAILAAESMTAFLPSVQSLLASSSLGGCGVCSICSQCYSNCDPGNIGFDQDVIVTQLCTQPTDTPGFWGCVCTQRSVSLVNSISLSLADCPGSTDVPSAILAEFSVICVQLGFTPVNFTDISGTSSNSLPLSTSLSSSQSSLSFPTVLTTFPIVLTTVLTTFPTVLTASGLNLETTTILQPSATTSLQST
jgi:hypothetical protein